MNEVKFNEERKFGVEIEMMSPFSIDRTAEMISVDLGIAVKSEGYNHNTRRYWKIVTDSSLDRMGNSQRNMYPMELVSPPLKGQGGLDEIKKMCRFLIKIGCKVNRSCGLHVHHDFNNESGRTAARFIDAYGEYETILDYMMAPSRRNNNSGMAKSVKTILQPLFGNIKPQKIAMTGTNSWSMGNLMHQIPSDRYYKINVHSFSRHGTIEIRHHHATINYKKIQSWVIFTQLMLEKCRKGCIRERYTRRSILQLAAWLGLAGNNNQDPRVLEAAKFLFERARSFASLTNYDLTESDSTVINQRQYPSTVANW